MNLTELRKALAKKAGITQEKAKEVIEALDEVIVEAVKEEDEVVLGSIGKFKVTETQEREGHNPKTGEKITIPSGYRVSFKVGSKLKGAVK